MTSVVGFGCDVIATGDSFAAHPVAGRGRLPLSRAELSRCEVVVVGVHCTNSTTSTVPGVRIGLLTRQQLFADRAWREGASSYHDQTTRGLGILVDLLDGYSDPPGIAAIDVPVFKPMVDTIHMNIEEISVAEAQQIPIVSVPLNGTHVHQDGSATRAAASAPN